MATLPSALVQQTLAVIRSGSRNRWLVAAGTAAVIAGGAQLATRARRARRRLPERRDWARRHNLDRRIAAEFAEMPGMTLTLAQAGRLLGVPVSVCDRVLGTLITGGVLRFTRDGHYVHAEALGRTQGVSQPGHRGFASGRRH